ncbi:unnamed protein product [Acanthoscelides obtectus]|nr:unnamed protein product [Acanthoscelides obtectus]CAK1631046.1 hypothetical protein AOBTE_LOCUS6726 [Acanthoscelides obtectus]
MYDPFAMYISAFSKTHGETPGDGKYHFLMNDAACSAPSDDPDDNNIIVATSSRPQSPVCIVSQDTTCTADTISEKSTHDSQSTPTSDDVSDASILIGTLDADQEEAEQKEDEAEEKGADDEKGVGEEGKIESEGEDNKEGERRNSKVSWGGYDDAATVDIVLSEEDHNDNLSHVQISESTNRSSDAWRYSTVERARPGKKSTSFVKKSLINGHLESPPPPPPTKRKWCGFFRRNKNKPDRKLKATKSKSETFDNDLDSTESSEISLDESRRDSMKSL